MRKTCSSKGDINVKSPFFSVLGVKAVDEQEANDRFVRLVGGVRKADRLQQIWNSSFPHGMEYDKLQGRYISREQDFRNKAKREGFSDRAIEAFLKLP